MKLASIIAMGWVFVVVSTPTQQRIMGICVRHYGCASASG